MKELLKKVSTKKNQRNNKNNKYSLIKLIGLTCYQSFLV